MKNNNYLNSCTRTSCIEGVYVLKKNILMHVDREALEQSWEEKDKKKKVEMLSYCLYSNNMNLTFFRLWERRSRGRAAKQEAEGKARRQRLKQIDGNTKGL